MNAAEVQNVVREYVVREILRGQDKGLDGNTPLLEWGVIDSLSLVTLVKFIEEQFSVSVPDEAIVPDNFATLGAISTMVERLSRAA